MKSPKQLRNEIQTLRTSVETLRDTLLARVRDPREPTWGIGRDCIKTAQTLTELLNSQVLPDHYKVAVVGRFKAGKSAFVNELLGARLAGENTSPETAAVTTFRHGSEVKGVIRFLDQDNWNNLLKLYQEDPKHIDAHRLKMWHSFEGKARKNSDGAVVETFDLDALAKKHITAGGDSIEILLEKPGDSKSENSFRRQLKEFTTGTRPHHCLVKSIEITCPSPLLGEGVLLVDTPGLDDTERFRVALTEKTVEDVDAVLFLTQSGAAYGQSEKDFMLTLLRRGTVKQLIFVVTQVDKTYEQHLKNADFDDEDPDPLARRIEIEEFRIRREIEATLDELGADDSPAMRHYREQLGVIGLAFTSAANHRDWKAGKQVTHRLHAEDPGGIEGMKAQLLELLSTESRLALIGRNIATGAKSALDDLLGVIANRLTALREIKDGEEAERQLANFRQEFDSAWARFQSAANADVKLLRDNVADAKKRNIHLIETIGLLAELELSNFETNDVGRHWRTRRSGNWGYMRDLQARVANRIFPRVQQMLSDMTAHFSTFVEHFEKHLKALSNTSDDLSKKLDLGASVSLDLTKTLAGALEKSLRTADELIAAEEQQIVSFLDDFVSDEVSDKITVAREKVSNIWGTGTTNFQSQEVQRFYFEIKKLLRDALTSHVTDRGKAFGDFLALEANRVPQKAQAEVQAALANAEQDIKAAATAKISGQREAFEADCDTVSKALHEVVAFCTPLLNCAEEPTSAAPMAADAQAPVPPQTSHSIWHSEADGRDWIEHVQQAATTIVDRYPLQDGDKGWSFSRIFGTNLLAGSTRVALIDPYLAQPHQLRNLKEFLLIVGEVAKPKEITILTSGTWEERSVINAKMVEEITGDIFRDFGSILTIEIDHTYHDRCVVCDHGVLFKLGRGLDIYKPAVGLASHRAANRKVRRTEIDVFAVPEWIVAHQD